MLSEPTESLCPVCLRPIAGRVVEREGDVYLEKECPDHGFFSTKIWRDARLYEDWREGSLVARLVNPGGPREGTCPERCGLCGEHEGDSCIAILHLTGRCDLRCPVCFADAGGSPAVEPSLEEIGRMLDAVAAKPTVPTLQLSGGEPTAREDLEEIVAMARERGIGHVMLNTNGVRLAREEGLAQRLADAGLDMVYLSFDGTTGAVYERLRGRDLLVVKEQAIARCADAGLGVILVPTVYPGVNDHELAAIVEFAREHMPVVKGVHFQPVAYFGRVPEDAPHDGRRVTLSDVVLGLVEQSGGALPLDGFLPRRKARAHCSFSSVFLVAEDGRFVPITRRSDETGRLPEDCDYDIFARETVEFNDKYWRSRVSAAAGGGCCCEEGGTGVAQSILDRTLTLSGMHFQDAWSVEIARLRGCCVHVVRPDGGFVPLCAAYLTASDGRPYAEVRAAKGEGHGR